MKTIFKNILSIAILFVMFFTSCEDSNVVDVVVVLPVLNTVAITNVSQTDANCSTNIISKGNDPILVKGICWSTTSLPTIDNDTTIDGSGTANYQSMIKNLSSATTYYARAYATTANETAYGKVVQITTSPDAGAPNNILNPDLTYGTVTDADGNVYSTIKIGNQTWMAENLITTKYRNGDLIPGMNDNSKWNKLSTGAQCVYNTVYESNSTKKFGRFYNYYAVTDARNIAPQGWHVPTDAEWQVLINYLISNKGTANSVTQAMAAKTDWQESIVPNSIGFLDLETFTSLNNTSGFSALPSGFRGDYGEFSYVENFTAWWSADMNDKATAWFRSMSYYSTSTGRNFYDKHFGLSVRCVKN